MGAAYAQIAVSVVFCVATVALLWRGIAGLRIGGGPWRLERAGQALRGSGDTRFTLTTTIVNWFGWSRRVL